MFPCGQGNDLITSQVFVSFQNMSIWGMRNSYGTNNLLWRPHNNNEYRNTASYCSLLILCSFLTQSHPLTYSITHSFTWHLFIHTHGWITIYREITLKCVSPANPYIFLVYLFSVKITVSNAMLIISPQIHSLHSIPTTITPVHTTRIYATWKISSASQWDFLPLSLCL